MAKARVQSRLRRYTPGTRRRCRRQPIHFTVGILEARVGIEPTHKGFADLSLTTWVPRLNLSSIAKFFRPCQRCPFTSSVLGLILLSDSEIRLVSKGLLSHEPDAVAAGVFYVHLAGAPSLADRPRDDSQAFGDKLGVQSINLVHEQVDYSARNLIAGERGQVQPDSIARNPHLTRIRLPTASSTFSWVPRSGPRAGIERTPQEGWG